MSAAGPLAEPLVRDLTNGANLPGHPARVDFEVTHGSFVFLAGDAVYKVKRAKDYGFFDYREPAQRRHFCDEEVRLNRRAAPGVYLGVLPVRRDERGHSLVRRSGEIVDWAVHMRRLPDDRSARALLQRGALGPAELGEIARWAARFYAEAERHPPQPDGLRVSIDENFAQVAPFAGRFVDAAVLDAARERQLRWLAERSDELAARPARDGHGDLRLEHVYLLPTGVVFIDCIEFLDRFRIADPALDAAFLAMDLCRFGRPDLAESFVGSFAYESDDYDCYPLIDGYMSYRAFVRAKVACFVAADPTTGARITERKRAEATALFALARDLLAASRPQPRVVAVGGMIASGKTTVAAAVAERTAAPRISADATRKHLADLEHEARGDASIYAPAFTARVHDEILRRAACVLRSGRSVILDTTFRSRSLRDRIRAFARANGARFTMIECRVPEAEARRRLRARDGGVSDAREELLDRFQRDWEPFTELPAAEHVVLDTMLPPERQLDVLKSNGAL